jgi:hypothetical protein
MCLKYIASDLFSKNILRPRLAFDDDGVADHWVVYGHFENKKEGRSQPFSVRRLVVPRGREIELKGAALHNIHVVNGHGTIGPHIAETPAVFNVEHLLFDEFEVGPGVSYKVRNLGQTDLVLLRTFGKNAWKDDEYPTVAA